MDWYCGGDTSSSGSGDNCRLTGDLLGDLASVDRRLTLGGVGSSPKVRDEVFVGGSFDDEACCDAGIGLAKGRVGDAEAF